MRSRTAIWFECKVRYEKMMEDGMPKKVAEIYTVDALSFSEAEERIMEETMMYEAVMITSADIDVLRISNSKMLLKKYLSIFIQNYIRESFDTEVVAVVRGENSYTILRKNNDFVAAFKIRNIECIIASPEELAKEKKIDKTAKNAE